MVARSERYEALVSLCADIAHRVRSEFYDDVTANEQAALERCVDAFAAAAHASAAVAICALQQEALEERAEALRVLS